MISNIFGILWGILMVGVAIYEIIFCIVPTTWVILIIGILLIIVSVANIILEKVIRILKEK